MVKRLSSWIADRTLLAKGIGIILIPLIPLVLIAVLVYTVQRFQHDAVAAVARSKDVETQLYELLALLGDAESGQRAYLLTADDSWRRAEDAARQGTAAILQRLDGLVTDSQQRERLARVPDLITHRLALLDEVANESRILGQFPSAPSSRLDRGRTVMTAVRAEMTAMLARQGDLLAVRTARAQRMEYVLLVIAGAGAAIGVLGGVLAVMLFTSGISSRVRMLTDAAARLADDAPLLALPAGDDEIGVLARQLQQAAALLAEREQELRRAHDTLNRFFTLSLDLFCVAGFDGYFKRLNPAWPAKFGLTEEELLGHPFLDFVHPDDRESTIRAAARLGQGDLIVSFENRYRCSDGAYRWLAWMAVPAVGEAQIYAVARDVTAEKETEARALALTMELEQRNGQLAILNQELEAFSYSVSHDLRAPLRSIDGFSQVLLEDYASHLDDEGTDALQRVRKAATAMGDLIDALLALSRVSRVELRAERVDMSAMTATIASELHQADPDRQAEFEIAPGMVVDADPRLLRSMLGNLLSNAWKYTQTREHARIEVGSFEEANETIYFVRDNGAGFDMAYVGKLFGAFQRLHRQSEFSGTGVGLATVQRIVRRHGGRAWGEGVVDRGATFYFTLPGRADRDVAA